jgi:hypothetical protein
MDLSNNFRGEFKVVFKKKEIDALFTMNALRLLLKNENIKLEEFDEWVSSDPLTSIPLIAYYSVINKQAYSGKKFSADKEMFIAEMLDGGQLENISGAMASSLNVEGGLGKA